MTDLVYILSDGGKASEMPKVLETLRGVRQFINIYAPREVEIDKILLTSWQDPEDALMHEVVLSLWVDAIISRNAQDYEGSFMPVLTCFELFEEFKNQGIVYEKLNGRAVAELLTFSLHFGGGFVEYCALLFLSRTMNNL